MKEPLVSICCLCYNHEPYIRECLDGFMMQKTDFAFEVLIHDDASTDNSAQIIREYEVNYPDIIKPIYQTENQYSKGVGVTRVFQFPRAKGKYIAMCEGDDYWTDPLKLQKQVDFLEENEEFSGCTHACSIYYEGQKREKTINHNGNSIISFGYFLNKRIFMATGSLIFRKRIVEEYPEWATKMFAGDFVLKYLILADGKIKYFNQVMSVYRKGAIGSWSNIENTQKKNDKEYLDNLIALQNINDSTNYKYKKEVLSKSKKLFSSYVALSINTYKKSQRIILLLRSFYLFTISDYKIVLKKWFER